MRGDSTLISPPDTRNRHGLLWRLAWQQSRSGLKQPQWRALLLALLVAITLATLLALLGNRMEQSLQRQTADILGADLVIRNSRPLPAEYRQQAGQLGLQSSEVIQFNSMLSFEDQLLLSSLKVVTPPYPLRGEIVTRSDNNHDLPQAGQIWVDTAILERLRAQPGDLIQVGYLELQISAVMQSSPDRGSGFGSFSPQALISAADLEASGLLGPGARVRYRQLYAGEQDTLQQFEQWLKPRLQSGERLISLQSQQNFSGGALNNAASYLRLGALLALLLCALTITLSLRRYTRSSSQRAALLLSLGLTPQQLVQLYLCQLLIAGLICALPGTLLAMAAEQLALGMLADLLPQPVPAASLWLYGSGALLGLMILLTLGLAPILSISRVSVSRLFSQQDNATPLTGRSLQLLALAALLGLLLFYLGDIRLSLLLLSGLIISSVLLAFSGSWLVQQLSRRLAARLPLGRLLQLRMQQQRRWHRLQIPAMSLLLAIAAIALVSRNDLIDRWQQQLPAQTPDHFVVNIQSWEQQPLAAFLQARQVDSRLYPMVRGRIGALNGVTAADAFNPQQRKHNALNRELNLTWGAQLSDHNRIREGKWHGAEAKGEISVETEMAQQLGLKLGDQVSFNIAGQTVTATLSSIRDVDWQSFRPSFYVIFSPGALDQLPVSYITSFSTPPQQQTLAADLIAQFPTLTLIDIRQLLDQARELVSHLVDASGLVMGLTLAAGLLLLFTSLTQELEQRRYENALIQVLGATPKQARQLDLMEFALLGMVCGLMAAVLAELALWPLYGQLIRIEPELHPALWVMLPLLATALFLLIGLTGRRALDQRHCYRLLRAG
ncbi:ABC transporter permease [Marinobacterium jannaschii]|uniref:ABC transporter permease n=1 Tax=Marinobacterium jannaschii TaxID=64970 RepID=UPI0004856688|nr:FtsX-like permease family protein [Marinobacterium jannaschii]